MPRRILVADSDIETRLLLGTSIIYGYLYGFDQSPQLSQA
ncbi:hypothetical protein H1P_5570004 [Hyella patelloides LEGE 07179]|uniref:Uncharacterized protein n=1 Tax=Hyella patelloides LEGE 07179 TaxID=945734 RepID=A0A563W0C8_9CYAN|nr:hypothetical protein H1P_5570004 [Hyella patelloides LEGE 07179]